MDVLTTTRRTDTQRFKIQEGGLSNGKWATNVVIDNKGNQVIHIPKCIANGQYLLRAEMVALHGARSTNGAQLYVSLGSTLTGVVCRVGGEMLTN